MKGLLHTLLRYLEENCDIVTNYDYIVSLLTLLSTIPLPSDDSSIDSKQLSFYLHCGDPDIEDVAKKVVSHWSLYSVCSKQIYIRCQIP